MIYGVGGGGSASMMAMAQMQQQDQSMASGLAGSLMGAMPMMMLFGPMGGLMGAGIGLFSASQGMQGNTMTGILGGATMGGMAGMVMGNPLMGMMAGGATAGLIGLLFNNQNNNQQQSQYSNYYPQANNGNYGGGYGNYGGGYGNYGGGSYAQAYAGNGYASASAGYYPPYGGQYQQPNYGGQLSQEGAGKPINYKTSGGWNVSVDGGKLTLTDPSGEHKIEHSGDPHEYVDGKHIKDWDEKTRTLILGDGTKITMNATGPQGTIQNYSIYDGAQSIQIDANGNKIDNVSFNPRQRQWADANQSDGETAYVGYNRNGDFTYKDIYKQNENLGVTPYYKDLATIENKDQNNWWGFNRVRDHYNDPRFLFT
ncbi:MAG: hypothetical protein AB9903_05665 [Vulcanimicrobiota bacterium]